MSILTTLHQLEEESEIVHFLLSSSDTDHSPEVAAYTKMMQVVSFNINAPRAKEMIIDSMRNIRLSSSVQSITRLLSKCNKINMWAL